MIKCQSLCSHVPSLCPHLYLLFLYRAHDTQMVEITNSPRVLFVYLPPDGWSGRMAPRVWPLNLFRYSRCRRYSFFCFLSSHSFPIHDRTSREVLKGSAPIYWRGSSVRGSQELSTVKEAGGGSGRRLGDVDEEETVGINHLLSSLPKILCWTCSTETPQSQASSLQSIEGTKGRKKKPKSPRNVLHVLHLKFIQKKQWRSLPPWASLLDHPCN